MTRIGAVVGGIVAGFIAFAVAAVVVAAPLGALVQTGWSPAPSVSIGLGLLLEASRKRSDTREELNEKNWQSVGWDYSWRSNQERKVSNLVLASV